MNSEKAEKKQHFISESHAVLRIFVKLQKLHDYCVKTLT